MADQLSRDQIRESVLNTFRNLAPPHPEYALETPLSRVEMDHLDSWPAVFDDITDDLEARGCEVAMTHDEVSGLETIADVANAIADAVASRGAPSPSASSSSRRPLLPPASMEIEVQVADDGDETADVSDMGEASAGSEAPTTGARARSSKRGAATKSARPSRTTAAKKSKGTAVRRPKSAATKKSRGAARSRSGATARLKTKSTAKKSKKSAKSTARKRAKKSKR
jgi:hypothetical protein